MRTTPYWLEHEDRMVFHAPRILPDNSDVVVIGGGFTGLSCAYHLSKSGANVLLIEAGKFGALASGQNGGHVNNGLGGSYLAAKETYGERLARELYWAYDRAVDLVEEIIQSGEIDCYFQRTGKLKAATKPAHFESLRAQYEAMLREVDSDIELVSASDMRRELGSTGFHGGLLYKKSAQMHMGLYSQGLARKILAQGGHIIEDTPVDVVSQTGKEFLVQTPRGPVRTREVVLATGTSRIGNFSWFKRRIIPVGSFAIVTEPLSKSLIDDILPRKRNVTTTPNLGNYFRILPDDRFLFGGRAKFTTSSAQADVECGKILKRAMVKYFPYLERVRVDYCWGGSVDMTANRLPRLGIHEGMHYAMGYSGHGAQISTLMGKTISDRILGRDLRLPFEELPWPCIPGYRGIPWFLPAVGAYYRFKDYIR